MNKGCLRFTKVALCSSVGLTLLFLALLNSAVSLSQEAPQEEAKAIETIVSEAAGQLSNINGAANNYFADNKKWPVSLSQMVSSGYLPSGFETKTPWGEEFKFTINGSQLTIDVAMPSNEDLADLFRVTDSFDAVTEAEKTVDDETLEFAEGKFSKTEASVRRKTKEAGFETFDNKANLERERSLRTLTITSDSEYLQQIRKNKQPTSAPSSFVQISVDGGDKVAFSTDQENFDFNRGARFTGSLSATKIVDADNSDYYLDPSKVSSLADVQLNQIFDNKNPEFQISPSGQSNLNQLNLQTAEIVQANIESADIQAINGSPPLNLGQLASFAVTQLESGDNIFIESNGVETGVGSVRVNVIGDPIFGSIKVRENATVGADLDVSGTISVGGDLSVSGDTDVVGDVEIEGNLTLNSDVTLGTDATDQLIVNASAVFKSGALLQNSEALQFRSAANQINSTTTGGLTIKASDKLDVIAGTINLNSSQGPIQLTSDVVDIQGNASVSNDLNVTNNFSVSGDVVIGTSSDDSLTINAVVQGSTPLVFQSDAAAGKYSISLNDTATDINLLLPNVSGQMVALDVDQNLSLPGDLNVAADLDVVGDSLFLGDVSVDGLVTLNNATGATPLSLIRANGGELISFSVDGGVSSFGLRAESIDPRGVILSTPGSILLNPSTSDLYINTGAGQSTTWQKIITSANAIIQGGNIFDAPMVIGTLDSEDVQIFVGDPAIPALVVNAAQEVSVADVLNVGADLNVDGDAIFNQNIQVVNDATLLGNTTIGDDIETDVLTINAAIQNDLVFTSPSDPSKTITLQRSSPTSDIELNFPDFSGTLVATDAGNSGKVSLPGDLELLDQGNLAVAGNADINGVTTLNNRLIISDVTSATAGTLPLVTLNTSGNQIFAFNSNVGSANSASLGVFSQAASPRAAGVPITANQGSIAFDTSTGALFINNSTGLGADWLRLVTDNEAVVQNGNEFGVPLVVGTQDAEILSLITNGVEAIQIDSDQDVAVNKNLSVTGELDITGQSTFNGDLLVADGFLTDLQGDVVLGTDSTNTLVVNARVDSNLVFNSASNNAIEIVRSAVNQDIDVTLPNFAGELVATNLEDNSSVTLPGALTLDNGASTLTVSGASVFNSSVQINSKLLVNSDSPMSYTTSGSELISFSADSAAANFSLYGQSKVPTNSALMGSLSVDSATGNLYINQTAGGIAGTTWERLLTGQTILQNGNAFGETLVIGTLDAEALELKTNNITALTIDTEQNSTFTGDMQIQGALTVEGDSRTDGDLLVTGSTTLSGDVVLGADINDKLTINSQIQNNLVFDTAGAGRLTLARSVLAAGTDTVVMLPNYNATLVGMDQDNNNRVQLSGDLVLDGTVGNGDLTVTGESTFSGAVNISGTGSTLSVATENVTPLSLTRAAAGNLIDFSSGGNSFSLISQNVGGKTAPTISSGTGSLVIDTADGEAYVNVDGAQQWTRLLKINEGVVQGGNVLGENLVIGTLDANDLVLGTGTGVVEAGITVDGADQSVIIHNGLTIEQGGLSVAGLTDLKGNLAVTSTATFADDVQLNSDVELNGLVTTDIVFATATPGNTITLERSNPAVDITLTLPDVSGTLVAQSEIGGNVEIPGSLNVLGDLTVAGESTFVAGVEIEQGLSVTANSTPVSVTNTAGAQLLNLTSNTASIGFYAAAGVPDAGLNSGRGSLAVDGDSGSLFINTGPAAANTWERLALSSEIVTQGGNSVGAPLIIGTLDSQDVVLGSGTGDVIPAITIDGTTQNVSIAKELAVNSGGLSVVGDITLSDTLTVAGSSDFSGLATFDGEVVFEPTSRINSNLRFGSGANILTLQRPAALAADITLTLPSVDGTLLALDASDSLTLPSDLNVAGSLTIDTTTTIANNLSVGDTVSINSNTNVPLVLETTSAELISFKTASGDLSLYSSSTSPVGSLSANRGSLNINQTTGDLFINNSTSTGTDWRRVVFEDGVVVQGGNNLNEPLVMGTLTAENFNLITNGNVALSIDGNSQLVTVNNGLTITSGDLLVSAGDAILSGSLSVSGETALSGNVILDSAVSFNGAINTDLVFVAPGSANTITLKRTDPNPAGNITLDMPVITGTLLATDSSGDLLVPGSLTVGNAVVNGNTTFTGVVNINNSLSLDTLATNDVPLELTTTGSELMRFNQGSNAFAMYAYAARPTTSNLTVGKGSLAVDHSTGDLYIDTGTTAAADWRRISTASDVVLQGGNSVGSTMQVGTLDGNNLVLGAGTGSTVAPVITISGTDQAVTIDNELSLSNGLTVASGSTSLQDLTVSGTATFNETAVFNGAVSFNDVITSNMVFGPGAGNQTTLSAGTPAADITLTLPNMTGTLLAVDVANDLSLPGDLTVANNLIVSGAGTNTFEGAVNVNNQLVVNSAAVLPLSLTTTGKTVLRLNGDSASIDFLVSATDPNTAAAKGSLAIDSADGDLFINKTGAINGWQKLLTNKEILTIGGNAIGSKLSVGTNDGSDVEFLSNSILALTISGSDQTVTIANNLTVASGGVTQLEQVTMDGAAIFNDSATFNQSVTFGAASAIESSLVLSSSNGLGSVTLERPAVGANDITLSLPSTSGTLLALSASGDLDLTGSLTLSGNLEVGQNTVLNGAADINGVTTIQSSTGVPLTVTSPSNQILELATSGSVTFGVYGVSAVPTMNAARGSLAVNTGTVANGGGLYINEGSGTSDWKKLLTDSDNSVVKDGGNAVASTLTIGTSTSQNVSFIANNTESVVLDGATGDISFKKPVIIENAVALQAIGGTVNTNLVRNTTTPASDINLTLPDVTSTLLGFDALGELSTDINQLSLVNTSAVQTPLSLTTASDQLISLTDKGGLQFGLYSGATATVGTQSSGSLRVDAGVGGLFVSDGSDWQRVLTEADLSSTQVVVNGGNTGPLVIGTTNSSILDLKTNDISALTIDSSQAVAIAKSLTVQEGLTVVGNVALGATDANSVTINGTITNDLKISADDGSAITLKRPLTGGAIVTLPSTSGTILTDNDNVTNIADNIVNTQHIVNGSIQFEDLDSGLTAQITSLGTLTGLDVSGASTLSTLNVTGSSTLASLTATEITATGASSLGSLTVSGASSLNTLSVSGVSALDSLTVTNASSLSSLSVTNASTLTGAVTTESDVSVGGDLTVAGTISGLIPAATSGVATLCIDNGVISTCSSLGALKTNATTLDMGMDTLMALQPKRFNWINGGREDLGFIAEEVEAVNPLLASYDDQGALIGVKYRHMTALLTKAVQEQQGQLENIDDTMDLSSGHMGIGTLAKNDFTLDVGGSIRATQFVESSDERLKTNVRSLQQGLGGSVLAKLSQIDGVFYDWNQTYRDLNPGVRIEGQVGVLAQQVESVLPHLVQTDSRGYKTVAYNKLTPYLIEGVNELDAKVQSIASVVQVEDGKTNLKIDSVQLGDVMIDSGSEAITEFRVKRSKALSSLMTVSAEKVADKNVEGYISAKDIYLADADKWGSDMNSTIETVDSAPDFTSCDDNSQKGKMALVSTTDDLYICAGKRGWFATNLGPS